MSALQYLPVWCAGCGRCRLQPVQPGVAPSCDCGDAGNVLPGQAYGADDVPLFERIEAAVRATSLGRRAAEQVERELRDVPLRGKSPEAALLGVLDHVPGLHFLLPSLQLQARPALERALSLRATGMLLTIVTARLVQLRSALAG